jgi:hypothetical protein
MSEETGKITINIDESCFEDINYLKKTWTEKGKEKNLLNLKLPIRITVLAAITSNNCVFAMACNNTVDHEIFLYFMEELCKCLYENDKNYKNSHIFLLDNAKIHKDLHLLKYYKMKEI